MSNESAVKTLTKSWDLIGHQKNDIPVILLGSVILGVIEAASVALLGFFAVSFVSPDIIAQNNWYKTILNFGLERYNFKPAFVLAILLIFAFTFKFLAGVALLNKILHFSEKLDRRLRYELMKNFYQASLSDLSKKSTPDVIQSVHGFTSQFSYGLVGAQLRSLTEVVIAIAILTYLTFLNPLFIGFLFVLSVLIVFVYKTVLKTRIHNFGRQAIEMGSILISSVQHASFGMREIKIYGASGRFLNLAKLASDSYSSLNAKHQFFQALPKYIIEYSLILSICLIVVVMQFADFSDGEMFLLIGSFGAAIVRLTPASNYVVNTLGQLRFIDYVVDRLISDLFVNQNDKNLGDRENKSILRKIDSLELKGVSFRYNPDSPNLFSDVNLKIHSGDSVGLIGPSGSGKSTLAELIVGLREPTAGEVEINGLDSSTYVQSEKFSHFSYIPQQVFLVDGTLLDNIALFDDAPDVRERASTAISRSQLGKYVNSLSLGLDTPVGENGAALSGGQRQRIALARALYHNRSILILDEATSALDYETEKEVIREVRNLKGAVTLVVVAHRLEAVLDCDRLFRVEDGAVKEIDHSELDVLRGS